MDRNELDLIQKSLLDELPEKEQKPFQSWQDEENNHHIYHLVESIRLDERIEREAENMRLGILDDIHRRMDASKRKLIRIKVISIAASIVLLIGFAGTFLYQNSFNKVDQIVAMSNPPGTKSEIVLPDGSTVILHGNSTISYPSTFSEKTRKVQLTGEAYFDIKRDERAPFIVQSGKVHLKVLGTTLNVEAYDEDHFICVTLASGKVSMQIEDLEGELILAPNQQAVFDKQTQEIVKRNINAEEIVGWTNDRLYFNSMPLKSIARKLERHFNVCIDITSEDLGNIHYTVEFVENESIDDILSIFAMMDNRITYTHKDNNIEVYEKR